MTGSSLLKVERNTREGHAIHYTLSLPWELRRIDYGVNPEIVNAQTYIQVKDLMWKGKHVDCFFMPISSMIPFSELSLDSHSEFLLEENAPQAFEGALKIVDVECSAKMDTVFEKGVWTPRIFKVGIFEKEDIFGEMVEPQHISVRLPDEFHRFVANLNMFIG